MKFERISKFKSVALVSIMLVFAAITVLGGVAVGDEHTNVPGPVLEISKTMTSGETTVYTNTKEYWTLVIVVTNNDPADLSDVVVSDTIPEELTLDGTTATGGSVTTSTKNEATKIIWTIGAMSPGDTETLTMEIATKTEGTTQYFLEAGEHMLNRGASVSGTHQSGTITAGPTDPITVYASKKHMMTRMGMGGRMGGMGGGMGGMWR